jgi:hypothetical protein
MIEWVEIRSFADNPVLSHFAADEGDLVGSGVRKIVIRGDDPRWQELIQLQRKNGEAGTSLGLSVWVTRQYTRGEWDAAELYRMEVNALFEPAGEECGTIYDDSTACPVCGAGRARIGPLRLNLRKVPKGADLAQTIAGEEVIVSERLADAMRAADLTGVDFLPVEPARRARAPMPRWFELKVTSRTLNFSPLARFGSSALKLANAHACPVGDTAGHALLSEAVLVRPAQELADFHQTTQFTGSRRGLLVPDRVLLVSRRVERLLHAHRPRRVYLEVARFTE